jgi:hypothetical protein
MSIKSLLVPTFAIFLSLLACQKESETPILLHPTLNEEAYSRWINDSTVVYNSNESKSFDVDEDGIADIEIQLTEISEPNLEKIEIWAKSIEASTMIKGTMAQDTICKDSIYIQLYLFYMFRVYSCNTTEGYEQIDTSFNAWFGNWKQLQSQNFDLVSNSSDSALLYYKHYYTPTIAPNISSFDIEKGQMSINPEGYLLVKKGHKHYALHCIWERPYFTVKEMRVF